MHTARVKLELTDFKALFYLESYQQKSSFLFLRFVRQEGIPSGMDLSNVNANYVSKQHSKKRNENIKGLNFNFLSCYLFFLENKVWQDPQNKARDP